MKTLYNYIYEGILDIDADNDEQVSQLGDKVLASEIEPFFSQYLESNRAKYRNGVIKSTKKEDYMWVDWDEGSGAIIRNYTKYNSFNVDELFKVLWKYDNIKFDVDFTVGINLVRNSDIKYSQLRQEAGNNLKIRANSTPTCIGGDQFIKFFDQPTHLSKLIFHRILPTEQLLQSNILNYFNQIWIEDYGLCGDIMSNLGVDVLTMKSINVHKLVLCNLERYFGYDARIKAKSIRDVLNQWPSYRWAESWEIETRLKEFLINNPNTELYMQFKRKFERIYLENDEVQTQIVTASKI